MNRATSESGFSIIEVFVSIVLLLVMAAVGTPALSEYNQQFQLRSAMDRLSTEIGRARMQAMAQSAFVRVRMDDGYFVRERSLDGMQYEIVGAPFALPGGINASITGTSSNITFDSTGISAAPAVITFEGFGSSKTLYTNILGRVSES
jgi:Tfp pilus assembly protein FimT